MRIKYLMQCRVPVNLAPKSIPVLTDAVDGPANVPDRSEGRSTPWEIGDAQLIGKLPFVPVVGMKLRLTPDAGFVEVGEVLWDCREPGTLLVWIREEPDRDRVPFSAALQAEGWTVSV